MAIDDPATPRTVSPRRRPQPVAISVTVPEEDMSYPVLLGPGMMERLGLEVRKRHPNATRVALVSDDNVMSLHGDAAASSLRVEGYEVHVHVVPAGEETKNPAQMLGLVQAFVEDRLSRRDVVVALGGGMVGDLSGLAAALFMRGIAVVQCPTSLLAQVDASVGGKVAVDLPAGKNLLGTFNFPSFVLIDPLVLRTLPDRELACGLAEMLKHGALFSEEHFDSVVGSAEKVFARDPPTLVTLVATSVALKAHCVSRDPREQTPGGRGRAVLNLGHTLGHALELVSEFGLQHGEAVALGLRAAARISERRAVCGPGLEARMVRALRELRLPTDLDYWLAQDRVAGVERALAHDKKRASHRVHYIALARVGQSATLSLTPAEIVGLLRVQ
ncbi:MAG: 3-dehydroquinate synthase [Nannocystaceae bacterium]